MIENSGPEGVLLERWTTEGYERYENGEVVETRPLTQAEAATVGQITADIETQTAAAALIEEATAIRDTLALMVQTPVAERDPDEVAAVTAAGTMLTMTTLGNDNPELARLRGECSALALAATQQRLAAVFATPPPA